VEPEKETFVTGFAYAEEADDESDTAESDVEEGSGLPEVPFDDGIEGVHAETRKTSKKTKGDATAHRAAV
jgi:hypothetical protein